MMSHADFSPRDWNQAPQYTSPEGVSPAVVLDFGVLGQMARQSEADGAFRKSPDGTLAKAPIFLDDLPAAFYRVGATHPNFTPNHNTSEQETIVVMEGVLMVFYNHGGERTEASSLAGIATPGEVVELSDEAVSMQAGSIVDPASCLALALYRDRDGRLEEGFTIWR